MYNFSSNMGFRDSLMVRMSACRVLDRGSIPRRGGFRPSIFEKVLLIHFN